jgi:hypothetical protein
MDGESRLLAPLEDGGRYVSHSSSADPALPGFGVRPCPFPSAPYRSTEPASNAFRTSRVKSQRLKPCRP